MSVDWTKPIQTRDGRKARLLGRQHAWNSVDTHVVAVTEEHGFEQVSLVSIDGVWDEGESVNDIINVPEPEPPHECKWVDQSHLYISSRRPTEELFSVTCESRDGWSLAIPSCPFCPFCGEKAGT